MKLPRPLIAIATVTAIVMAPSIASASEVLEDGTYDIAVTEESLGFTVLDGAPELTGVPDGWLVAFTTDDDGKVLDTFTVSTPEGDFEVTVGSDGPVITPIEPEPEPEGEEPEGEEPEGEEPEADASQGEESEESESDESASSEEESDEAEQTDEDADEVSDEVSDDDGPSVTSTIAACVPQGRLARDAGWPNQGRLVSAAARGDVVSVGTVLYDLSDEADLAALCDDAEAAVAALDDEVEGDPTQDEATRDETDDDVEEPTDVDDDEAEDADDESVDSEDSDDSDGSDQDDSDQDDSNDSNDSDDSVKDKDKDAQRGNGNARGRPDHAGGPGGR